MVQNNGGGDSLKSVLVVQRMDTNVSWSGLFGETV